MFHLHRDLSAREHNFVSFSLALNRILVTTASSPGLDKFFSTTTYGPDISLERHVRTSRLVPAPQDGGSSDLRVATRLEVGPRVLERGREKRPISLLFCTEQKFPGTLTFT